jgi:hypothetical protein
MAYDHGGIKALKPKPNGGRKHENMTLAVALWQGCVGAGSPLQIERFTDY